MANNKKIISPVIHPAIIIRVGLKPDASDREMIANTPGPGVIASTNIAIAKLKIDITLILIPCDNSILKFDYILFLLNFKIIDSKSDSTDCYAIQIFHSSRRNKNLTAGIHDIFRGSNLMFNAETGEIEFEYNNLSTKGNAML
jgi:hypothetical protein